PTRLRVTRCWKQVSWLAGRSFRPPSQDQSGPSGILAFDSPLTVAGAAAAWPEGAPHSLDQPLRALPATLLPCAGAEVKRSPRPAIGLSLRDPSAMLPCRVNQIFA